MTIPLRILFTNKGLYEHPDMADQLAALRKQGHEVLFDPGLDRYDFIVGPNCWFLRADVAGLFTLAVKNARRIANADTERVAQVTATKAAKTKPRRPRKVATGNPAVKETITGA